MSKIKVAFTDIKDYEKNFIEENRPDQCEFFYFKGTVNEVFENNFDKIKDIEILSIFTPSNVPKEIIEKLPNLKLIALRSTGYNHVDTEF